MLSPAPFLRMAKSASRRFSSSGCYAPALAVAMAGMILSGTTRALAGDACDLMVAKLAADHGVQFERRTEGGLIHLKHPLARSLSIDCSRSYRPVNLFVSWNGAFPTADFYTFVGRIGAVVVGKPAAAIEAGSKRCQRAALKDKDEQSEIRTGGLEFDCQAFTRDGGSSAFTIVPDQPV